MKYYISKPVSHKLDESLIEGIKQVDSEAEFVKILNEADIVVFQKGWTKSKICVADYHLAKEKHIERREANLYIDNFSVKTN